MNKELMGALDELERDKNISKETLLDAIEQSLIQAYKNHFGKADNVQGVRVAGRVVDHLHGAVCHGQAVADAGGRGDDIQIGRASCRERVFPLV